MPRRSSHRRQAPRPHHARSNRHSEETEEAVARLSEEGLYQLAASGETEDLLFLVLDGVQDPHNLGACLRSADGAGAAAVIVPKRQACPVTDTVIRVACGAAAHVPVVYVTNLARCLDELRDREIRLLGTSDRATQDLYASDLSGPLALVMGAEEQGMRRLTTERCDELVQIPMAGTVECLNVSAAAAVCLFEAVRQRLASEPS